MAVADTAGRNSRVTVYTDGAARGNPEGPVGYGTVIQFIDSNGKLHEREYSAGYKKTKDTISLQQLQRMERTCLTITFS